MLKGKKRVKFENIEDFKKFQKNYVRIAGFEKESIVDGPGIRYTIFVQGCPIQCKGCHNPETHDTTGGKVFKVEDLYKDIKANPLVKGVTFSGGEPTMQHIALGRLASMLKEDGYHIMMFSGFLFENLIKHTEMMPLFTNVDILVDGPFILDKRTLDMKYRGSKNQRIIDMQKSLEAGQLILHELN